jgi:prepilin-type N-terminal cleavage/methylation domain-containing protein
MRTPSIFKQKEGITLIELLVALVIFGIVIGAIYRLFIVQTKAYTVQDQAVEVQQNVRSAMEILLRDLRMTGYDDDSAASNFTVTTPIAPPLSDNSITVSYEYYNTTPPPQYELHTVAYSLGATNLIRQLTVTPAVGGAANVFTDSILENVDELTFGYGVDTNGSGAVNNWFSAAGVGTSKIIAIQVRLTARPDQTNPDVKQRVSSRRLTSAVMLRNLIMK